MKNVVIEFDIYCDWQESTPIYRIYVDDDLLTERTYIWNNEREFVRERVVVCVDTGSHRCRIEKVGTTDATFSVKNINIDDEPVKDLDFVVA